MKRRDFMGTAIGATVGAGLSGSASAQVPEASASQPSGGPLNPLAAELPPSGFNTPLRFDAEVDDCLVVGTIPEDMDGAFYRVGGEFYYPPLFPDDAPLNADGYISMFRIKDGKAAFRGRWVETERFKAQRAAKRQLYGYYRNPFTDDPSVRDPENPNRRTVANTAPLVHGGKLFATKEDGLPHLIDPNTLETVGPWDFDGGYKSQTFSAHPKLDPVSGDMIAYGYEADGLASDSLWVYRIGADGAVKSEVRTKVPYVSVMHDMALTQKHMLFPFGGYVTSMERLREGKVHWGWDQSKESYIGVLPRDGGPDDMRWFKGPLRCMMHTFNAHDEGDKIVLYAPFWDGNFFPFFPNVDGSPFRPELAQAFVRKITLDLSSPDDTWTEEILWDTSIVDLGKVDPRVLSLPTRYLYTSFADPSLPFDTTRADPPGRGPPVNCYGRFDLATGELQKYFAGDTHALQEVTFVPREGGSEGQGYIVGVASNFAEDRSEMIIADAENLAAGDIARIILPFKLSSQVHGVWASAKELPLT
ncbi:carotenoid oxygenase family protein [Aurantiacibacter flavus]|uniref:Dioxygenase n=1 Tax=Aurantiacibacter flavus TaxID=3145232 RepID=A0ABV0CRY5_9SPHN